VEASILIASSIDGELRKRKWKIVAKFQQGHDTSQYTVWMVAGICVVVLLAEGERGQQ
jgi:hypothetical protein